MSDSHRDSSCAPVTVSGGVDRFRIDELLEIFYYCGEDGESTARADVLRKLADHDAEPEKVIAAALAAGLATANGALKLTSAGEERARGIVRRHRLAEILFSQVLEVPASEVEQSACEMEHILSSGVTDSVCTFLGHPPRCPHGRTIPPGECCKTIAAKIAPLVIPLADLDLGKSAPIVFISTRATERLTRLADLGLLPGARARLRQRQPSFVIDVGETTLALEREIVREIYVRRED